MNDIFKDIKDQVPFNLNVNREIIFTNFKNIYKKRIEKRQRSLLKYLSFIDHFLDDGEVIFLVTTACSPASFSERFWTGLNLFSLKHSLLIFTDKRVFHVPVTKEHVYKGSIANFFYKDCESMRLRRTCLIVRYKNGKKEKFHHVSIREERKIKALLKTLPIEGQATGNKGRVHLCPCCTCELEEEVFICSNCKLEFKDKSNARKISIIYPGGGYFYTRHLFLGIADVLTEALLLGLIVLCVFDPFKFPFKIGKWGILLFSLALVLEKFLTAYHSNSFIKEFIPKQKKIHKIPVNKTGE